MPPKWGKVSRRGRGGHIGRREELDAEAEQSHHEEDANASQSTNHGEDGGQGMKLKEWLALNADEFHGKCTPMEAASWLNTMEMYMAALELSSRKRVLFVPFQLKRTR